MGVLDTIKDIFGGNPHEETAAVAGAPEDTFLGTQLATTGTVPDEVTKAEEDPALRDVAAGAQPSSKPTEVEREEDLEARRDDAVARTD